MNIDDYQYLSGAKHVFPDGIELRVISIKEREGGPLVAYETCHPASLPRRFSLKLAEFMDTYGHLFPSNGGVNGKI